MSHLSHKNIMDSWNLYEQQTLNVLKKQKKTFECFELLSCLIALGLTFTTIYTEKPAHKTLLLANSTLIGGLTAYADVKKQKKLQQRVNQLQQEKIRFFNQFRV